MNGYQSNQLLNSFNKDTQGLLYPQDKLKTKAYINPQIVNLKFLKTSLSKNVLPPKNKIHINPNFKGLNCLQKKNSSPLLNDSNYSQGSTNVSNERTCSNPEPNNFFQQTFKPSQFKKVNNNLKSGQSKYSWKKNSTNVSVTIQEPESSRSYKITPRKLVKINTTNTIKKSPPIFKSKTKIINKCKTKLINKIDIKPTKYTYKPQVTPTKFIYKNIKSPSVRVASLVRNKYKYYKMSVPLRHSRYKIDKRKKVVNKKRKDVTKIQDIRKLFPKNICSRIKPLYNLNIKSQYFKNLPVKNIHSWRKDEKSNVPAIRKINRFSNKTVVKIGGILYKSTANKLTLANKEPSEDSKKLIPKIKGKKNHIVYVRGEKFILDRNGKTLKKHSDSKQKTSTSTPKRIDIGGVTYIQKSRNVLVRTNVHHARYVVNKAKNKSIALLTSLRKRSSMPCMIFHKFGRCLRHSKGLCMYKHDPKNIAICKRFLKGVCEDKQCLLSHEVIQEKMATCYFFLNGSCVRENCPYLHVKLSKNAEICKKFLQGFCDLGKNCTKRHTHLCPEYDKKGSCSQGSKCPYPHKTKDKATKKDAEKSTDTLLYHTKSVGTPSSKKQKKRKRCLFKNDEDKKDGKKIKKSKKRSQSENSDQSSDLIQCVPKRIKLDTLPCFIPLKSDS